MNDSNYYILIYQDLGDLGATYNDHLRLIEKHVADFLLVSIELFFARCYG